MVGYIEKPDYFFFVLQSISFTTPEGRILTGQQQEPLKAHNDM